MMWILENWVVLIEAAFGILSAASLIAGLTETKADDEFIKACIQRLSFLKPKNEPGTLKWPFTKS